MRWTRRIRAVLEPVPFVWLALASIVCAAPSFDRNPGEVSVGTCEGLKTKIGLGLDIAILLEANILCKETVVLAPGQAVSVASATDQDERYAIVIAEDFEVVDGTAASVFENPDGAELTLENLEFANEAGAEGVARAVWNSGTLLVYSCTFVNLNFASRQDGGAIYSMTETSATDNAGYVHVSNSTFLGNIAKDYGGAILAQGSGSVEFSNCTFSGNEAVGNGGERRSGAGGAIYAHPGVLVTILNSTFEGCLGRYGGSALFVCGADIVDSTFAGNEATGLFGAVVNGDLSEEERLNMTSSLGASSEDQNYTCPELTVSGSLFDENAVVGGYGGAIASVDAPLYVYNTSLSGSTGGALYFGTSDPNGRDEIELDTVFFNSNEGSASSPSSVGAAFFLELTGSSASNTTGDIEDVSTSASSVVVQSVGAEDAAAVVGTGNDLYCFSNEPYDCEGYFGDASMQLQGIQRCAACLGNAFTGIGSPQGAPTPAPFAMDDDDGLSQKGQERAQGGTPSPTPLGGAVDESDGGGELDGQEAGDDGDDELLGVSGSMRWVVLGLVAGLGIALIVCLCLMTVCRVHGKGKKQSDREEELPRSASVGPRASLMFSLENEAVNGSASLTAAPRSSASEDLLFTVSPGGTLVHADAASRNASLVGSRRASRTSSLSATPLSSRKNREVARQRVIQMSADSDRRAEEVFSASCSTQGGRDTSGAGLAADLAPQSSKKEGFAALRGMRDASWSHAFEEGAPSSIGAFTGTVRGNEDSRPTRGRQGARRERSKERRKGRGSEGSREEAYGRSQERHRSSREGSRGRSRSSGRSVTPEGATTTRAVKTPAGGARLPIQTPRAPGSNEATVGSATTSPRRSSVLPKYEWAPDTLQRMDATGSTPARSRSPRAKPNGDRKKVPGARGAINSHSTEDKGQSVRSLDKLEVDTDREAGWASDLYRLSSRRSKGSAKIEPGKSDSSKGDWSPDGEASLIQLNSDNRQR